VIIQPNRPPVANDDAYATDEDTPLVVAAPGVLDNDTDADGDPLSAGLVSGTANGVLSLNGDGSFSYTPSPNFNGLDSFTYVANDGLADSNVATVTITVNDVNDPPVADPNGPYSGEVGNPVTFDGSGSVDPDGTIVSYDWDFGDGGTGTGVSPTHTYAGAGTYTVTLTVTDNDGATDTATTTAELKAIEVTIDIKPGSYPNSINLGAEGIVSVAVITTSDFDATNIDPVTVSFAGANPLRWSIEDVDEDGDLDLVFKFKVRELVLVETTTEATFFGQTFDGLDITGTDSVRIVPEN
jgi:PKD repeat protein